MPCTIVYVPYILYLTYPRPLMLLIVVQVMSYFNILLGITPTWEAARKYIFKEFSSLLKFMSGVSYHTVFSRASSGDVFIDVYSNTCI